MKQYLITFMAAGPLIVEAESEEAARELFEESDFQVDAAAQLARNGVELTDVQEYEE